MPLEQLHGLRLPGGSLCVERRIFVDTSLILESPQDVPLTVIIEDFTSAQCHMWSFPAIYPTVHDPAFNYPAAYPAAKYRCIHVFALMSDSIFTLIIR